MHKGFHTFSEGICPKINATERLEFEHDYYDVAGKLLSHDATGTSQPTSWKVKWEVNGRTTAVL